MRFKIKIGWYRGKRGSFLLEALLAVLILSVGLVGLIRGLLSSLNAAKESEAYSRAILAANNAFIETVRLNGQKLNSSIQLETDQNDLTASIEYLPAANSNFPAALHETQVKIKWPGALKQKEVNAVTLIYGPTDEKK